MKSHLSILSLLLLLVALSFFACKNETAENLTSDEIEKDSLRHLKWDQVHPHVLNNIRLGDGVPVSLHLSLRWKIENPEQFNEAFSSVNVYSQSVVRPRALEITSTVSNTFASVDSVFSNHRQLYINEIKNSLSQNLGEEGITFKEIIISDIVFPKTYTDAMEQAGLQRQELERINQQNIADIAQADANKKKAEADAKVDIARAEAAGRLQKIQSETEKSRRASELAKAETQNQVSKMQTEAEAERKKLMARADLENKTELKNLEIQRLRELDQLAIEKERQLEENKYDREAKFAQLCSDNPNYAAFLVNKELAAKVQIAVLPNDVDKNVLTSVIQQTMPSMKKTGFVPK